MGITETDTEFVLKADLPGVAEEEGSQGHERFHRVERFYGHFQRSLTLPEGVEDGQVKATISDDQLSVTVPDKQAAPPSRPVEVPGQWTEGPAAVKPKRPQASLTS